MKPIIKFLLLILILSLPTHVSGQCNGTIECNPRSVGKSSLRLDIAVGANISTETESDSQWFGRRNKYAPDMDLRFAYMFNRHWGAYGELGLSFYKLKRDDRNVIEDIFEGFLDIVFPGISKVKPRLLLGVTYSTSLKKWELSPRLGLGYEWILSKNSSSSKTYNDGNVVTVSKEYDANPLIINPGINIGYRLSRVSTLFADISYNQPLTSSSLNINTTSSDNHKSFDYNSSSFGRNIILSIGIRLQTRNK